MSQQVQKIDKNNFAYIDGANLHKAIEELGWELDYRRFRIWLLEKYGAAKAYIFIGLIPKYKDLYQHLQECGFTIVFKETTYDSAGKTKGNCDAELVLQAAQDFYEKKFDRLILISGDGDFSCLANFLLEKGSLALIIAPNRSKCSYLLRRIQTRIVYLDGLRHKLGKRKSPQ